MTKKNPRFPDLESWYFRSVGDSFAEFKAGGIAVVCGVDPRDPENILGYRPCVGMVGGTIYFRGPIKEYSKADVKLVDLTPAGLGVAYHEHEAVSHGHRPHVLLRGAYQGHHMPGRSSLPLPRPRRPRQRASSRWA